MCNNQNNLDYFHTLSESEDSLMNNTISNFKIPPSGVVIVFDKNDYHLSPLYPNSSIWKNLGNHLNLQEGDGYDDYCPYEIKNIIMSFCFHHMVWLSKRARVTSHIDFVWNLSHELRHLEQDLENRWLSLSGNFLYHNIKRVLIEEESIDVTIPTELDAELYAWRITRKIFGNSVVDQYVQNRCKYNRRQRSFQMLCHHDPDIQYDVCGKTISLLHKYESPLNKIIDDDDDDENPPKLKSIYYMCSMLLK